MLYIPTTEIIPVQFDVLVLWMFLALGTGLIIGYRIKEFTLRYRLINIQSTHVKVKDEILSTKL